jgi:hypothetical protein
MNQKWQEIQIKFIKELAAEYKSGKYSKEGLEASNTLWCMEGDSLFDKQVFIDGFFRRFMTEDQHAQNLASAVRKLKYAEVLKVIIHHLGHDSDDRGEVGFAPLNVRKAGDKARDLLYEAMKILEETPPLPY